MTSPMENGEKVYSIQTLGKFDVMKHGESLVMSSSGSKKIWELYKFMLTHRDRTFTPESLMDQLWVSEAYNDPRSTLRRQMHRLRQSLREEDAHEQLKTLQFTNGYYKWNEQLQCDIDTDQFEALIKQGDLFKTSSPEKAIAFYLDAISLYHGDYLPECFDQHWIFSIRNHYRRLFLSTVLKAVEILKNLKQYDTIISLCQKAVQIDIYEEVFHLYLMEALLKNGDQKQGLAHYEHITGFYYHEMGLKPSAEMKLMYKRLLQTNTKVASESTLMDALESNLSLENAFYCEPEVFKSIYELERRRSQRSGAAFSIGVIGVAPIEGYSTSQEGLRISHLKEHLMHTLRKGDTFTLWNESQFIVLLPGVDGDVMKKVLERVLAPFPKSDHIEVDQIKELS